MEPIRTRLRGWPVLLLWTSLAIKLLEVRVMIFTWPGKVCMILVSLLYSFCITFE